MTFLAPLLGLSPDQLATFAANTGLPSSTVDAIVAAQRGNPNGGGGNPAPNISNLPTAPAPPPMAPTYTGQDAFTARAMGLPAPSNAELPQPASNDQASNVIPAGDLFAQRATGMTQAQLQGSQTPTTPSAADSVNNQPGAGSGQIQAKTGGEQFPYPALNLPGVPDVSKQTAAIEGAQGNIEAASDAATKVLAQAADDDNTIRTNWITNSNSYNQKLQDIQATTKADLASREQQIDSLGNVLQTLKLDPQHFWAEQSTPQTLMNVVGMALGAFGASVRGGPNFAQQIIDNAISRDIDAQKQNFENTKAAYNAKVSAYGLARQAGLDDEDATKAAYAMAHQNFADQIAGVQARVGNAMSNAQLANMRNTATITGQQAIAGLKQGNYQDAMGRAQLLQTYAYNRFMYDQAYGEGTADAPGVDGAIETARRAVQMDPTIDPDMKKAELTSIGNISEMMGIRTQLTNAYVNLANVTKAGNVIGQHILPSSWTETGRQTEEAESALKAIGQQLSKSGRWQEPQVKNFMEGVTPHLMAGNAERAQQLQTNLHLLESHYTTDFSNLTGRARQIMSTIAGGSPNA